MTLLRSRRRSLTATALALLTATLVPGLVQLPSMAAGSAPAAPADTPKVTTFGDLPSGLEDLDTRGSVLASSAQRSAAAQLGAVDVRWNRFGTPSSLLPADGSLGPATSDNAEESARSWLRQHAAVFGLTTDQVDALETVNSQAFAGSGARAVLFRQKFGELAPALDSMVTVGVANGQIAYASSSITRTTEAPATPELSAVDAWVAAAESVGRNVSLADVTNNAADGWNRLTVTGFPQEQQVRLRALANADGSVRPVFEANVVDVENGASLAYTLMVDAVDGEILHRDNKVENSSSITPFQGEIPGTTCGEKHPFELTDGQTRQVQIVAAAANSANDIVIKLLGPGDAELASGDLLTSPETLTYAPGDPIPAGVYNVQICPFEGTPFLPPTNYVGSVATSDEDSGTPELPLPRWRFFPANPTLDWSADHVPNNDVVGCWTSGDGCTLPTGPLEQPFSAPWDYDHNIGAPTHTSAGNNVLEREAWASPLTPGGAQAPVSATREYVDEFQDVWNNNRCNPAVLTPGGNDIFASVSNLFVAHNRMHDYSYGLGFTERNYNMQVDNLGRNTDPTRDEDPEIGNVQAGAITGGAPSYLGRDNANQITLQDGVPGITNQYLFQPIAGAFYSPCADGGLDMSIVGHEYTHAISNRMIAGPDQGIGSEQGGAMGESWGDLVAAEYMFSHGYANGANPWAVGPYATGNKNAGIRDYPINGNPLNYSDYGFDLTGVEVHADGEIWNGTMWEVRDALVRRWNSDFPYASKSLQRECAQGSAHQGPRRVRQCPGNRRWVTLMFDSFLLQQGATSMLDARDAMLAADRMRFDGNGQFAENNQKALWDAFARRGMGRGASTPDADSGDPKPSFASPLSRNAVVTFRAPGAGDIFVGDYEARATPVADTRSGTAMDAKATLAPGRYRMLFASPGHHWKRFTVTVGAGGRKTVQIDTSRNLASEGQGAEVIGSSAGSLNAAFLLDGTEATNWGGVNEDGANVDETSPFVSVDLAGGVHTIRSANVSAMLTPPPPSGSEVPAAQEDPDSGSRFTALRRFALERCTSNCGSADATWTRFFVSGAGAFPAERPRPVAPNLILRSFDVPDVRAAAIRLVALENQCTGFSGYAGEQDDDPANATDCKTASDRGSIVHAAELQVF